MNKGGNSTMNKGDNYLSFNNIYMWDIFLF
jgi:hypothetical protein